MYMYMCAHSVHGYGGQRTTCGTLFSSCTVGISGDLIVGLGGKHLYPACIPASAALAPPSSALTELQQQLSNLSLCLFFSLFKFIRILLCFQITLQKAQLYV